MAALPSPTQVAGNNSAIYEAYYNFVDPNGVGTVGAMEAARFLKKSGLSDVVLSRIWDLSDPGGRGCLDKTGMFVALKLVSLAQGGHDINMSNINKEMPPPKMGDVPLPKPKKPPLPSSSPLITSLPASSVDWSVKPAEREKYDKLFDSLQPINGMIPGNKVKGVLMDSKLPFDTLGRIWDLADQDKDGQLDRNEFIAAMHLVYKALEKYTIPNTLPPELMAPAKRKGSTPMNAPLIGHLDGVKPAMPPPPMSAVPPMSSTISAAAVAAPLQSTAAPLVSNSAPPRPTQAPAVAGPPWVVTPDEKSKSDAMFIKSDIDKDGFVSGQEIRDVFLQSGVPQKVLAHIWSLCDINESGKLNNEQFALAMWFVARCLKGVNPPPTLAPDMIPPSFRTNKPQEESAENNNSTYSNPELEMISKDIQELTKERYALEHDITQKEADIKIKTGEIKSLQSELDTLAATLKQLENQKGEAMKRLGDLKMQMSTLDDEMEIVNIELDKHSIKVEKLRTQAAEQAEVISSQEAELMSKKEQLESLKKEEQRLEQLKIDNTRKLEDLTSNLQSTQLTISQAKAMIPQLQEQTRQLNDAISSFDNAISIGDATSVPDTALRISPDFRDPAYKKIGMVNGNHQQNGLSDKPDPFSKQNGQSGPTGGGFQNDPFANDPFKSNDAFGSSDPFEGSSGFDSKPTDGFSSDPFNSFGAKADPFNAFGDSQNTSVTPEPGKDAFGCDPFAVLHAPTREDAARSTSPSPALPPKKAKPPRPAPPRPHPPSFNKPDAFGSGANDPFASSGGGFANFADFDSKFSDKPSGGASKAGLENANAKKKTGLDFTDDPFRDYRYEDPFNITFDEDDPELVNKNSNEMDHFDPFSLSGRQSVPLPKEKIAASSNSSSGRASAPPISKKLTAVAPNLPVESEQLAWAAQESLKMEEERKKRQLQEQADLELAIALSKADNNKK